MIMMQYIKALLSKDSAEVKVPANISMRMKVYEMRAHWVVSSTVNGKYLVLPCPTLSYLHFETCKDKFLRAEQHKNAKEAKSSHLASASSLLLNMV